MPGPGHSRRGGTLSGFRRRGRLGIRRRSPPLGPSVSSRSLTRRPAVLKVWVDTHRWLWRRFYRKCDEEDMDTLALPAPELEVLSA